MGEGGCVREVCVCGGESVCIVCVGCVVGVCECMMEREGGVRR